MRCKRKHQGIRVANADEWGDLVKYENSFQVFIKPKAFQQMNLICSFNADRKQGRLH